MAKVSFLFAKIAMCERSLSVFPILYRLKAYFVVIQIKLKFVPIQHNEISVIFLGLEAKLLLL